ncbi:hypothetical protein H0H81_010941 [Sphagnurus paluster]|uniref:MARVEL domain-containing protein n=1 Tax=Sphagnurus paluster TaxID=117069 RepID=A0A9P7KFX9_9AGAR|nr:hypothetical protein H0H81_010941 [Sphagnurus paluster]
MGVMDQITDFAARFSPKHPPKQQGGIGGGGGMAFEDDMIVSKPTIVFHASQIFFSFLAMACFASVASFQAKWGIGPSGLSGFALFIAVAGMFLSSFMLFVPVVYEKYDRIVRLARALKEVRVCFILTGIGTTTALLIAFITTISAWTQAGCKNAANDPHAELGDDFTNGLDSWCSTKKAGAVFFWLSFVFWLASLGLLVLDWRSGKLHSSSSGRGRDPPFTQPEHDSTDIERVDSIAGSGRRGTQHEDDDGEEDETDGGRGAYTHVPRPSAYASSSGGYTQSQYTANTQYTAPTQSLNTQYAPSPSTYSPSHTLPPPDVGSPFADPRYDPEPVGRPSMDAYGAFSDPAPSGFAAAAPGAPRVSRTMQYADPYSAVRASIAGSQASAAGGAPPTYESYEGYR